MPAVLLIDGISVTFSLFCGAADGARRALLAHLPAQGAGLRPLLRAARRVRHRHAAGRVGRRARAVLRGLGADRHLVGAVHRVLPRARRAGALVGARVRDLSAVRRRAADRHRSTTFELLGSARFSALPDAGALPAAESTALALLFLLSAMGKSAQLPFSGWLPRAMEGPDAVERALLWRGLDPRRPLPAAAGLAGARGVAGGRGVGVARRPATALYAAAVARVHTDAKGALAHATLAQVGLILAEICARAGRRSRWCTWSATRCCASASTSRRRT